MKRSLSDLQPTNLSVVLWQLCILLTLVGAVLREYEFFAGTFAILAYLVLIGIRFNRQLLTIRPRITIQRRLEGNRGHVGGTCQMQLDLSNETNLTVHVDRLEDKTSLNGTELAVTRMGMILRPRQKSSGYYEVKLQRTGLLVFESVKLWIADDRHLYQSSITIQAPGRIEVDAAPVLVPEGRLTPMQLYGGAAQQRRIGPAGTDYAATRAYLPGDEMRRIDWKATARLRKLMVREFHAEASSPVIVLMDAGPSMWQAGFISSRFEEGMAVARLVAETALDSGDPFGFGIFDQYKLREHWEPELRRSRIGDLRRIALETKAKPLRGVLAEPRMPITRRSVARQVLILENYANVSSLQRLATFLRSSRSLLTERFRTMGPYNALRVSSDLAEQAALIIILTDLQTGLEGLLEGVRYSQNRGHRAIIAQIAAPWRLETDLENAYENYESNQKVITRLRDEGALVLDTRPEQLLGAIDKELAFEKISGSLMK